MGLLSANTLFLLLSLNSFASVPECKNIDFSYGPKGDHLHLECSGQKPRMVHFEKEKKVLRDDLGPLSQEIQMAYQKWSKEKEEMMKGLREQKDVFKCSH